MTFTTLIIEYTIYNQILYNIVYIQLFSPIWTMYF